MSDPAATTLGAALLLGLVGSVHCLGMCGGVAGALGQALPERRASAKLFRSALYSLGRITSYAAAGAAAGLLGGALIAASGLGIALRVLAGLLIVGMGLHVGGFWNALFALERAGLGFWRRILPLVRSLGRPDRAWKIFATGLLWGWLPCGLVYSSLAVAGATGNAGSGALFMACFGLGTLPSLLFASSLAGLLREAMQRRATQRGAAALLLVFGLWTIVAALAPMPGRAPHGHAPTHVANAAD